MQKKSKLSQALLWAGVAGVAVIAIAYGYRSQAYYHTHAVRADNGCLAYAPSPMPVAILNDDTDALTADQPRRWRSMMDSTISGLPVGSKMFFARIGASAPTEVKFDPVVCVPPGGKANERGKPYQRLEASLDRMGQRLERASSSPRSAISATVLAVANDPVFQEARRSGTEQGRPVIVVASDLLENDVVSAYRVKVFKLPPAKGAPFKGMTIRLKVLKNAKDGRYQTRELIATWIAWLRAGGAEQVEIDAPWLGFSAPVTVVANETSR